MNPPAAKTRRTASTTDAGSPPKRPRIQPEPPKASTSKIEPKKRTRHTHSEIWKWTFTPDAVAPCRARDVLHMEDCDGTKDGKDPDFYWLGRVPCRSVLLYGIIVGVQQYENRTVYSLDDGTAQIECNMRHMAPPPSPKKASSKYRTHGSPRKTSSAASRPVSHYGGLPPPPKPVAVVGDIVRVQGRVLNRYHTRILNTDSIVVCKNPTEEPLHWLAVAELHKTYYHPPNPELFVIPKPTVQPAPVPSSLPANSSITQVITPEVLPPDSSSPSKSSVVSSAPSTPSSTAAANDRMPSSPPRLRHPSRLHTRDLTANTFRIYLKHYMDNAPKETPRKHSASPLHEDQGYSSDEDIDFGRLRAWLTNEPETPTKKRPGRTIDDATPRPNKTQATTNETPRQTATNAPHPDLCGLTLSHLRRVPELHLLARRVVDAEAKRRAREERKKQKEATQPRQRAPSSTAPKPGSAILKPASAVARPGEPKSAKMKRLFRYAIRQLYEEGSIVLWDGPVRALPVRPIPALSFVTATRSGDTSDAGRLWKMSSSASTVQPSVSGVSSVSQQVAEDEDDDGELSDPPNDEDAYVPLTSAYLCSIIEHAIKDTMSRPPPSRGQNGWKKNGPSRGPTPQEITNHLHRRDERWARVGEWAVKDALDWGKSEGRVWCIGDDRWEICG